MKKERSRQTREVASLPPDERGIEIVAERFRALGDTTRLKIVRELCKGERCVQDLMADLEVGQTSLSKHLGLLLRSGLIANRREGRFLYYRLQAPEIEGVCGVICQGIKARLEQEAQALDLLH